MLKILAMLICTVMLSMVLSPDGLPQEIAKAYGLLALIVVILATLSFFRE